MVELLHGCQGQGSYIRGFSNSKAIAGSFDDHGRQKNALVVEGK